MSRAKFSAHEQRHLLVSGNRKVFPPTNLSMVCLSIIVPKTFPPNSFNQTTKRQVKILQKFP